MTGHATMTAADLVALFLFLLLVVVYWFPYLIAMHRKSDKTTAIALTLFFFGLTGVGWIIALTWALRLPRQSGHELPHSRDAKAGPNKKPTSTRTKDLKRGKQWSDRATEDSQVFAPSKSQR